MSSGPISALLFDKDGTLFGFHESWGLWCQRVLQQLAPANPEQQQLLARAVGYDLQNNRFEAGSMIVSADADSSNRAWAALLPELELAEIERAGQDALIDLPVVPVVNDLAATLGKLRDSGYLLGVATNDFVQVARQQLTEAGILPCFDFVAGFDSGYGAKPGAGMIQAFCSQFQVRPDAVAMIGDSTHDMHAGRNAGAGLLVAVASGPATADELRADADVVLEDIGHLANYLATDADPSGDNGVVLLS